MEAVRDILKGDWLALINQILLFYVRNSTLTLLQLVWLHSQIFVGVLSIFIQQSYSCKNLIIQPSQLQ